MDSFWHEKTIEELAAEQGITVPQSFDDLFGAGTELWASDEEFEAFLAAIRESRNERTR